MFACLEVRTYMGMGETWQLIKIRHFHVAFKLVCGSRTYYILYIRTYVNSAKYRSCILCEVTRKTFIYTVQGHSVTYVCIMIALLKGIL